VADTDDFAFAVRREFASLIETSGFHVVSETNLAVRLQSASVAIEAKLDPREGVQVDAMRLGHESLHERWTYSGMIGKADATRLLQIALERLQAVPALLAGNHQFFEDLTTSQVAKSKAWTDYYARKGPQPTSRPLP
jgi:hypothetical protein